MSGFQSWLRTLGQQEGPALDDPTLSVVAVAGGTSVTATVAGESGATHQLYYRVSGSSTWTTGLTRVGDGTITQTGLTADTVYTIIDVQSKSGVVSNPSLPCIIRTDATTSPAGTSAITLSMATLRTMLSECSHFQTLVGAADAAGALASIYLVSIESPHTKRPFALIRLDTPAKWEARSIAGGAGIWYATTGAATVVIEEDVPTAYAADDEAAETWFMNYIGDIIEDLEDLAGVDDHLAIHGITIEHGPVRARAEEEASAGDYYQVALRVEWGI